MLPAHNKADHADRYAHELANLLDASLRNIGLAVRDLSDAGTVEKLESAAQAMQRMAGIIRQWHDSTSTGGRGGTMAGVLHDKVTTFEQAVAHAVRLLSPAAAAHHIRLRIELDATVAPLPAGPIYTILTNALRNSIEALAPRGHGQVTVTARLEASDLVLGVTDDGPGPDASLFDAQGRVVLGRSTKPGSKGLGLRLSREVAASLGGTLRLERVDPHGARLTVRFPVKSLISSDA